MAGTMYKNAKADLEAALQHVPGLMSYTLARSEDGGVSVTVCDTQSHWRGLPQKGNDQ